MVKLPEYIALAGVIVPETSQNTGAIVAPNLSSSLPVADQVDLTQLADLRYASLSCDAIYTCALVTRFTEIGAPLKGDEIAEITGRSPASTRQHLNKLSKMGVIIGKKGFSGGFVPSIETFDACTAGENTLDEETIARRRVELAGFIKYFTTLNPADAPLLTQRMTGFTELGARILVELDKRDSGGVDTPESFNLRMKLRVSPQKFGWVIRGLLEAGIIEQREGSGFFNWGKPLEGARQNVLFGLSQSGAELIDKVFSALPPKQCHAPHFERAIKDHLWHDNSLRHYANNNAYWPDKRN